MKLRHSTEEDLHIQWLSLGDVVVRAAIRKGPGTGRPLFVLNGIGACFEMLLPFVDAYPHSDVILFDVPGAGKSAAPALPWRLRDYARVAAQVLDTFEVDKANLMGISWGGALAQQFVRQYPERVDHLVLAATSHGQFTVPGRPRALAHMLNPRRYVDKAYMKRIAGTLYGGKLRTNSLSARHLAELTNPPSRRGYYYQMLALLGWTSLTWLRGIEHPTMVLHGEDDPIIPLVNAKILAGMIPGARLRTFNCGHLFMLTRAERVARTMGHFFESAETLRKVRT